MTPRLLARAALYAAVYAAVTLLAGEVLPVYGPVQFRVSEALLAFACVDPAAVLGLTVGTAIGNVASPIALVDVPFGALLTLLAAGGMYLVGPRVVALCLPVVVNGLGVALELALLADVPYWYAALFVSFGEAVVLFTGGLALLLFVRRRGDLLGLPPGRLPVGPPGRDESRRRP